MSSTCGSNMTFSTGKISVTVSTIFVVVVIVAVVIVAVTAA